MIEVAAFITTMNFFASADTSRRRRARSASAGSRRAGRPLSRTTSLLREAPWRRRAGTADVAADDLDFPAAERSPCCLCRCARRSPSGCGVGELARQHVDHADPDWSAARAPGSGGANKAGHCKKSKHVLLLETRIPNPRPSRATSTTSSSLRRWSSSLSAVSHLAAREAALRRQAQIFQRHEFGGGGRSLF